MKCEICGSEENVKQLEVELVDPKTGNKKIGEYILCERCLYVGGISSAQTLRDLNNVQKNDKNYEQTQKLINSLKEAIKMLNVKIINEVK